MSRFTPAQTEAIEAREPHILVSAAAGSGKTSVLIERIIQIIQRGEADVTQLLVLTFTNAAAGEMRQRLKKALREAGNTVQLRLLGRAQIGTVHNFCGSIIRQYFVQAGVEPGSRILDDTTRHQLQQLAIEDAMQLLYDSGDPDFLAYIDAFSGGWTDNSPREQTQRLYDGLRSLPDWQQWFSRAVTDFAHAGLDFTQSPYAPHMQAHIDRELAFAAQCLEKAGQDKEYDLISTARQLIGESLETAITATAGLKKITARNLPEDVIFLRNTAWKTVKKLQADLADLSPATHLIMTPALHGQAALLNAYHEAYAERKKAINAVDFSDLEHACLQALRAPEVAQEVSDKFKFTFVDEYQDTSPLQEAIVQAVAGEGNLFMVGDLKQAIYSFRDCDPGLFRHKMHTFPMQRGGKNRVIYLDQNFRSAPALLTGINDLFKTFMNAQTLDIDYDDTQSLKPGLDVEDGPIEVHFTKDADDEARAAAAALLKWKNENKELQWRDCAVLLRTPRGERLAASIYANILQSAGIPCRMEPCEPLFDAPENRLLIELCRFCDNSRRELPLLSVLLSPLFGYTVDELLRARLFSREETLYNCMRRAVPGFWQTVSRWQDNAATSDPADWLWNIIEETGYTQTKNVQALMHHCERFCDDTSAPTLHSMLQYLDAVSQKRDYLGDPAEPGEEDAVSILSVHKSKGLEWPCVVVGGCGKGFRGRPKDAIIWDSNIGIGPRYYDVEARLTGHTPASRCLSWQAEDKERAEEARLLYVAMTRAKRKLVLVGTYDAEEERFGELPDGPLRAGNAGCWADWIAPSFSLYTESKPTLLLLPVAGLNHRKSDAWISPTEEITEEAVQNQHSVPAKISVTAYLKNQTEIIIHETDDTLPPADLETGTAYHSTLEKLDFANKNPILPSAIDPEVINWFLSTDLAQEMSAAPELLREQPFTYLLDDTLITGVIDACFRTPQGYVIVDYKVSRQTSAALKTQYAPQLQFYAKAAAELTGQPVVRLCLVHLMRREIIVI